MSSAWYLLPSPIVFKVSGKDARRYLNNRLSNDLRTATPGSAVVAGALTPQGKVEGLFVAYVVADDLFYLVSDGGARQTLFSALSRYIVADRVSIVDCTSESVVGHRASQDLSALAFGDEYTALSCPRQRIDAEGRDFLVIGATPESIVPKVESLWGRPLSDHQYNLARFSQGFAQYPGEINDTTILTETGAREAVSFTKGCYVGQEVIERSDAIGKLPRTLERVVLERSVDIAPDSKIATSDSGQTLGKVMSSFQDLDTNQTCVFALMKTGSYTAGARVQCDGISGQVLLKEQRTV